MSHIHRELYIPGEYLNLTGFFAKLELFTSVLYGLFKMIMMAFQNINEPYFGTESHTTKISSTIKTLITTHQ